MCLPPGRMPAWRALPRPSPSPGLEPRLAFPAPTTARWRVCDAIPQRNCGRFPRPSLNLGNKTKNDGRWDTPDGEKTCKHNHINKFVFIDMLLAKASRLGSLPSVGETALTYALPCPHPLNPAHLPHCAGFSRRGLPS